VSDSAQPAEPACSNCEGSGRVEFHDCRTEKECGEKCPCVETCMACLGSGKQPQPDGRRTARAMAELYESFASAAVNQSWQAERRDHAKRRARRYRRIAEGGKA
jgi:hypothetical protein